MAFVIRELLGGGLLHRDILTVADGDLDAYAKKPVIEGDTLAWPDLPAESARFDDRPHGRRSVLARGRLAAPHRQSRPRHASRISAVDRDRWTIEAPARVFSDQD